VMGRRETGNALFSRGDFDGAIAEYSAALQDAIRLQDAGERATQCAVLLSNRAACYLNLQQASLAARDAQLASRLAPDYAKAYYRLACALERVGDHSGAAQALERSRQLKLPNGIPALAPTGPTSAQLGDSLLMAELHAAAERARHTQQAGDAADDSFGSPGDLADPAERVEVLLETLRTAKAGTEMRRAGVEALLDVLREADGAPAQLLRPVINAFVDGEGPRLLYEIESSMTGDWMTDAKNGTLRAVSAVSQLPGPVGLAVSRYRGMAQARVEEAALHLHSGPCTH